MIERYSRPEMAAVWTPENKFRKWLQVEVLACEAWAKLGKIPPEAVKTIKKKADFDPKRVDEIEQVVKHDVIAFLTNVAEYVGEDARFIHMGLTSSDVLDTALAIQMKEAAGIIIKDINDLLEVLKARAFSTSRRSFMSLIIISAASFIWMASAVSRTSDEVRPMWMKRASSPTYSATLVRNAITSCFTTCSISSTLLGSKSAFFFMVLTASGGILPSFAHASQANTST